MFECSAKEKLVFVLIYDSIVKFDACAVVLCEFLILLIKTLLLIHAVPACDYLLDYKRRRLAILKSLLDR